MRKGKGWGEGRVVGRDGGDGWEGELMYVGAVYSEHHICIEF